MSLNKKTSILFLILGHIYVGVYSYYQGVHQEEALKKISHILSDAFIIPGVFLTSIGLLILISSTGQFDGINYTFYYIRERFPFLRKDKKTADFGEFRDRQKRRKDPIWPMILPGLYFLGVAAFFILLYLRV